MSQARVEPETLANVLVVGAGVAGTGAALAAAAAGAHVTVIDGGTGASTLATGALDWNEWRPGPVVHGALPPSVAAVVDALGAYAVPAGGATVLTMAGVVRPARGYDRALLDVTTVVGRIGVVACRRPGWNAATLASAWGDSAAQLGAFAALGATIARHTDESTIPNADFAARHDDADRLPWLGERLREALARSPGAWDALALPPMLGVDQPRAEALSRLVGLPCGEATAPPGGPSGLRFERARDRAFAGARVRRASMRASAVERHGEGWRVKAESGETLDAHAVILATGGLVGGGLEYAPADAMFASALPALARPTFRLTMRAPFVLGVRARPLELPGSLFGAAPEELSAGSTLGSQMDRVGVLDGRDENGVARDNRRLFAAGDVTADEPRTWLGALASGVRAGLRAAAIATTTAPAALPASSLGGAPANRP